MWALFKDNKQVSKEHSTKQAVVVEAMEAKAVWIGSPDFLGDKGFIQLATGYEIKKVNNENR